MVKGHTQNQSWAYPAEGKVFNILNDWYLTTPQGVTLGPYASSKYALALLKALSESEPADSESDF